MKKLTKRALAGLLVVLMVVLMMPVMAFADGEKVAKIGDTEFDTLQAAVNGAADGDTVILLKDVELPTGSFIIIPRSITVDFGAYTVSGVNCTTYPQALFQIKGNPVTFKGTTGGIEAKAGTNGTRAIAIESNQKLIIESGVYSSMNNCTIYADNKGAALEIKGGKIETKSNTSSGNYKQTVTIDGDLTITGGTIINEAATSSKYIFQVDGDNSKVSISGANITAAAGTVVKADNVNVEVEIKDCTVNTTSGALANGGKITIKEGTKFESTSGRVISGAKLATIEGGSFKTDNAFGFSSFPLNIKDGEFEVKQLTTNANSTNIKISGGEFDISDTTNATQVVEKYLDPTEESGTVEVVINEKIYEKNETGEIIVSEKVAIVYNLVVGSNCEWTKSGTTGLVFTSNAPFAKFDSVKVDGSTLAATNYTAEEGSTKITLAPAYLETLSTGTHTIEIISKDGSVSASFTIKAEANSTSPQTGDNSHIFLWFALLIVSGGAFVGAIVYGKKRRKS